MKRIVILISGRGSNMEALIAARDAGLLPVNIAAVISNRPEAKGLATAGKAGITAHYIDHKAFAGREAFDAALEPDVNIIKAETETREEFRIKGKLYMVKVTPTVGKPYYLGDRQGDGNFIESDTIGPMTKPPMWILNSW